jgi:hypothetical protein
VEKLEEPMGRKTIEEVLVKTGLAAEFEAQGRAEGKASSMKQTLELLRSGKSVEELTRLYEERLNVLSQ